MRVAFAFVLGHRPFVWASARSINTGPPPTRHVCRETTKQVCYGTPATNSTYCTRRKYWAHRPGSHRCRCSPTALGTPARQSPLPLFTDSPPFSNLAGSTAHALQARTNQWGLAASVHRQRAPIRGHRRPRALQARAPSRRVPDHGTINAAALRQRTPPGTLQVQPRSCSPTARLRGPTARQPNSNTK